MYLIRPPITGDLQLDAWTDKITNSINQGLLPGAVGGPGGVASSDTGGGGTGTPGADGADGNTAIYLYARTNSASTAPTRPTSVSYNLDADPVSITASGGSHTWEPTPTALTGSDRYLWITFRYVSDRSGAITDSNSWDTPVLLGLPGDDAVNIRIESYRLPTNTTTAQMITAYDAETFDFSTLRSTTTGFQFRNDTGEDKVLLATVQIGGLDAAHADHYDYNYTWSKNGLSFTPNITGQNLTRRMLVIDADDVADGGEDVFSCTVSET